MTDKPLSKITIPSAATVLKDIELSPEALELLDPKMSPAEFLNTLVQSAKLPDAVRFLARALPRREAAWWGCVCSRAATDEKTPEPYKKVLELAELWVFKPTEENRVPIFEAAQATQFDHPSAWAAMAAYWSMGSMAPPDAPPVQPAENLTAKAAAGAVMLAAVHGQPDLIDQKYRRFLEQGKDIARGGNGRIPETTAA